MTKMSEKRVQNKIKELAKEYREKGFDVVVEPGQSQLPEFMRGLKYSPDIIARSVKENLIIEVKTNETTREIKAWAPVADSIRDHEGWDFVLVMTNPRNRDMSGQRMTRPDEGRAYEFLAKTNRILAVDTNAEFSEAALLLGWAATEAMLRYALAEIYDKQDKTNTLSLIRDSVMYGVVSSGHASELEELAKVRNTIAHGLADYSIDQNDVRRLLRIAQAIRLEIESES